MLGYAPGARSLLEVGCGTGHFSRRFAARGPRVVGLDASPAMLAVALEADQRSNHAGSDALPPQGGHPRASHRLAPTAPDRLAPTPKGRLRGVPTDYVLGSAAHLPFPDRCFDVVTFITSLEFVADPAAALREAARVARQGLLLGVLNLASPLGAGRKLRALWRLSPYRAARFYTPWGLERLIRRALGGEVRSIAWRTTLWPRWVPEPARRLPFGGFIGALVLK